MYRTKWYVREVLTYIPCFSPEQNCCFFKNSVTKKDFNYLQRKDFLQIVQKISLWESYYAHSKKDMLNRLFPRPQLGHSCDLPSLACLPNFTNSPWVPHSNKSFKTIKNVLSFRILNTPQTQSLASIPYTVVIWNSFVRPFPTPHVLFHQGLVDQFNTQDFILVIQFFLLRIGLG